MSNRSREDGFTLMEVAVAIFVLTTGLLASAALAARVITGVQRSKYMSIAATLASEKIEDLNRWQADNRQVCVPAGNPSVGSLNADILQITTCAAGATGSVNYFDDVNIGFVAGGACGNTTDGCFSETVSSLVAGVTNYTTVYQAPDGSITTTAATPVAPVGSTFHRRWLIEANTPVAGVRRVTMLVTLNDPSVNPPVTFQMSTVRR